MRRLIAMEQAKYEPGQEQQRKREHHLEGMIDLQG